MRILLIDVGRGTTDILLWDDANQAENQTHLIVPSATRQVAKEIAAATARGLPVLFTGELMGGGPNTEAMRRHVAAGLPFYATAAAAKTFDDDLTAVAAMGVQVLDGDETGQSIAGMAQTAQSIAGMAQVRAGDVRFTELKEALRLVGEDEPLDACALAVQDHGEAPAGVSDRAFRFARLAEVLQNGGRLDLFFYPRERIPPHFTRMRAAASLVDPDLDLVVGDTGPAALWGAALAGGSSPCLAINFGNGHTLMALVEGNRFDGLFEHHTASLSPERMEAYIRRFAAGEDLGDEVFAEGGHGALPVSTPFSLTGTPIVVTGPRRQRFGTMKLPLREVSLHGDMMLTGCYGLLAGYRARRSGVQ